MVGASFAASIIIDNSTITVINSLSLPFSSMESDNRINSFISARLLFDVLIRTVDGRFKEGKRIGISTLVVYNGRLHWPTNGHTNLSIAGQ